MIVDDDDSFSLNREKTISKWVICLLAVLTCARFLYCTHLEVIADEAYYFLWSKHLAPSYYSKGPAIAWTIAFGTKIFGDNAFGIRWIAVMLAAGTGWQIFLLARRLFNAEVGLAAVLTAVAVPLFAVGATLMTIDPLSVFFWIWAANIFWNALEQNRDRDWILLGFAVGCGFLAKFVNALELLAFAAFLAWSPEHRKNWRNPKLLWVFSVFLFCIYPIFYWNSHNGWITATHLQARGALDHSFHISFSSFAGFFLQQGLVISPTLFPLILIAVFGFTFRKEKTPAIRLLLCLFWVVFGFYSILALNDSGEANWTATAYTAGLILTAAYWLPILKKSSAVRWSLVFFWTVSLILTTLLHETRFLNLPKNYDPLDRARGWSSFGNTIQELRLVYQPDLLIGNKYQTASLLSYYLPGRPTTFIPKTGRVENQFSFWPSYKVTSGSKALFVTDNNEFPKELLAQFNRVERVKSFTTSQGGRPLVHYDVFLLQKY